jgi:hypothetical protein
MSNNGSMRSIILFLRRQQNQHRQQLQQHHQLHNGGKGYIDQHPIVVALTLAGNSNTFRSLSTFTTTTSPPLSFSRPTDNHDDVAKDNHSNPTTTTDSHDNDDYKNKKYFNATKSEAIAQQLDPPITAQKNSTKESQHNDGNLHSSTNSRANTSSQNTNSRPSISQIHFNWKKSASQEDPSSSSSFPSRPMRPSRQTINMRKFRDEYLPCRQHLDPHGRILPTSNWIQLVGTLPVTKVGEVVAAVESTLNKEAYNKLGGNNARGGGIIDLDAVWNPIQDGHIPPTIHLEDGNDHSKTHSGRNRCSPVIHNHTKGTDENYDGINDKVEDDDDYKISLHDDVIKLSYNDDDGDDVEGQSIQQQSQHKSSSSSIPDLLKVHAAHVSLSPFGRPNGWTVQLANPSIVNAILNRSSTLATGNNDGQEMRVGWKLVKVHEYHPPVIPSSSNTNICKNDGDNNDGECNNDDNENTQMTKAEKDRLRRRAARANKKRYRHDNDYSVALFGTRGVVDALEVDDSMVRFENCPPTLDAEYLRSLLSRYDLAPMGDTVLKWDGETPDGRVAPLTYVVRFASPAWARAAVRELQATYLDGKMMKLVQYPNQMRAKGY